MNKIEKWNIYSEKFTKNELENLYGGKNKIKISIPTGSPGPTYPESPADYQI
jgi:hypothetical protein